MNKSLISAFLLIFLLSLTPKFISAQKVKIKTDDLEFVNNKLIINYSFVKGKSNHRYKVWVEITKSTGEKINASALSGDIGDNIQAGEKKQIVWDYNKDGFVSNDEINAEVMGDITTVLGPGMGKAMLLSTAFPGLGLTKLDPGKPYWLMGVAGYALIGSSVYFNNQAAQNLDAYEKSEGGVEGDNLYDKAEKNSKMSKTLAYSAIGLWAGNLIWTAIKAKNSTNSVTGSLNKKQKIFFYGGVDPKSKSAGFTLKYRF